jgi:hypothetical protein
MTFVRICGILFEQGKTVTYEATRTTFFQAIVDIE